MSSYTLGIDLGTTGTKAVLLDVERGIVAEANRASVLYTPFPGAAEAAPAQWLQNAIDTIGEVLRVAQVDPRDVVAVAATGMLPAVVVVDESNRPLRNAILQNDTRATEDVGHIAGSLGSLDIVHITGSALTQQSVAPKLRWLARNEADVMARVSCVLGSYDWLLVEMGADRHLEQNWAIESGVFRLDDQAPIPAVLDASQLDRALFPPVRAAGTVVGAVDRAFAERSGLSVGTALVVGGADHVLSAYAAGVEAEGDWLIKLGGAGDILVASDTPVLDERLYLDAHPVPGRWLPNGCMATSGSLIRWLQDIVGGAEFAELEAEARDRPPADLLCLPYFLGEKSPLHDPDLRGAYVGLHLGHTRADLYRATMEGIAFGFRHHTEVFHSIGLRLDRALITNGGSKSRLWKQIHADVLNTPVTPVAQHPGASLGAAIVAAVGAGARDSWTCVKDFLLLETPIEPDRRRAAHYEEAYATWRDLGDRLTPVSHDLAARTRRGETH